MSSSSRGSKEPSIEADPLAIKKLYNTSKFRKGNNVVLPTTINPNEPQNSDSVRLVPIRLDLDVDGIKIKDTFTWNLNEKYISPEQFAQTLVDDISQVSPISSQNIVAQIASSIKNQCISWQESVNETEDLVKPPQIVLDEDSEWRIIIKLDLQIGDTHLNDQFEWPLLPQFVPDIESSVKVPTPEKFASQLCADLGIAGEFVSTIAHSIREQLCFARLNFDEAPKTHEVLVPPIRTDEDMYQWQPTLEELDQEELERRLKEQERSSRRLRRSQRSGNAMNTIVIPRQLEDDAYDTARQRISNFGSSSSFASSARPAASNLSNTPYASFSAVPTQYNMNFYDQLIDNNERNQDRKIPYRNHDISKEEEQQVLRKLEESAKISALPPATSPPKRHRGFGASANRFNESGSLDLGEFRAKWRCAWCLLSGKFTPTLRKGPMGSRTLCNACGIWYGKHGNLPADRYQEHAND